MGIEVEIQVQNFSDKIGVWRKNTSPTGSYLKLATAT